MPAVVHCRRAAPGSFVYVGRPTKWGNPFHMKDERDRDGVVRRYEEWIAQHPDLARAAKAELRGRDLGCWCAPRRCHADVLLRIANED